MFACRAKTADGGFRIDGRAWTVVRHCDWALSASRVNRSISSTIVICAACLQAGSRCPREPEFRRWFDPQHQVWAADRVRAADPRCLLRSLLIGQLPRPPVHLSHEPSRWGGVRQARVRQPWKAGPEHRGLRLICDKGRPTAAVPMHGLQGEPSAQTRGPRTAGFAARDGMLHQRGSDLA